MIAIGINGFGRIGRVATRILHARRRTDLLLAVNDLTDAKTLAHLLKYDTNYGIFPEDIRAVSPSSKLFHGAIRIGHHVIGVLAEPDPAKLPWKDLGVELVIEATGRFTESSAAEAHLRAGAKQVIISAPSQGANPAPTSVIGVNAGKNDQAVINNASCTTNCIAPVIAILEKSFGVEKALMTTAHGYTAEQNLQDGPHHDLRRARNAAQNIIPTTTGAAIAVTEAIPSLKKKFDGVALRVPVAVGSISDITALLSKNVTVKQINEAFIEAAHHQNWRGIIATTEEPIVSSDIIGRPESAIIDLSLTRVVGGNLVKIFAWYDNEWGYSQRLIDQALRLSTSLSDRTKEV